MAVTSSPSNPRVFFFSEQAEIALLMEDDDADGKHKHFNYDKIVEQQNLSKKKKKKLLKKGEEPLEDDDFQVC